jgi:solute:Na+ symporter, SSS family
MAPSSGSAAFSRFTMKLQLIDWVIAGICLVICFLPALFFGKRAGRNTSEFFASGRAAPWWLAGLSMVATTFSSDTPNLVTDIVRRQGVAGNWCWWAFAVTGVATVFFYARLWRRSEVMTDLEFYELRYSGKAASVVRGFRAVYLGLLFNCVIMASVNLAACKIANILFGLPRWQTLLACGVLNVMFAAHAGLWGVLVIDMVQFFVKMTAVIAAAYFAVQHVGGLHVVVERLSSPIPGLANVHPLNFLPDFHDNWSLAVTVFIMPLAVQWWATWYPGSEPGGGSYIAQRMLASRSEKDSLGAVLFFNIAHYVLRPWPWILVGLCSLLVYPELSDIQKAFPNLEPKLLGHDMAYPAMLKFLPVGFVGLMVGGLVAAHSSTILTHLNWGSSYVVHDFYRRFLRPGAAEKHYVLVGRLATGVLFLGASGMVYLLDTAKDNFDIILQIGAGTGLLYLLRWFWWRINAWCEVAAMVTSFGLSIGLLILKKQFHFEISTHYALLLTIGVTTMCWILTAWWGPATDRQTLVAFYRRVRPFGPGWNSIRKEAGLEDEGKAPGQNLPLAILGWVAGCATIWSALFTVGSFLYGRLGQAGALLGAFIISGSALVFVVNRLWTSPVASRTADSTRATVGR